MKKFGKKSFGSFLVGAALLTAVGTAHAADQVEKSWQFAQFAQAQPAAKPDGADPRKGQAEKQGPKGQEPRQKQKSAPDEAGSNQRDERRSRSNRDDAKQPQRARSGSAEPMVNADPPKSDPARVESRPDRRRQQAPASQVKEKADPQSQKPQAKSNEDAGSAVKAKKQPADTAADKRANRDKSANQGKSPTSDKQAAPVTPPVKTPPAEAADAAKEQPAEQGASPGPGTRQKQTAPGVAPSRPGPAAADAAPTQTQQPKGLDEVRRGRRETKEDGGRRTVITEPGDRKIIRQDNRVIINHNEAQRFQGRRFRSRMERGADGLNVLISIGPRGVEIVNVTNRDGRLVRRYRRHPDGREVTLIDNRSYFSRHRGAYVTFPVLALGAFALTIPREQYIVEYRDASEDDIYQALSAPPLERLERRYSLEEIRYSHPLRERLRRIDLDDITFETGAWEIDQAQMAKLDRVARVMKRIIEREPTTVFLIEGHTDAVGSEEDNLTLSDRRAEAVAIALTDAFDVPPESLVTQGYGEAHLKVQSEAAERANRRASVRNVTKVLAQR
jgi:outer membrane protein OmpA-like peptidoglycan-associated protein